MAAPTHCRFEHPGLSVRSVFRRADGIAAMAMAMNGTAALLPLAEVARVFGIGANSPDGQMLRLVGASLRFVPSLSPGDALPAEVLTGDASWQPAPRHREAAAARVHGMLLAWLGGAAAPDDAGLRRVAAALDLVGGGPAVATLIEALAEEVAFIEALRDRLLVPLQRLVRQLEQVLSAAGPAARRDRVREVVRLAQVQAKFFRGQLAAAGKRTDDLLPALKMVAGDRRFLHMVRDTLFCELVDWEPVLAEWDVWPADGKPFLQSLNRLHGFLAARAVR